MIDLIDIGIDDALAFRVDGSVTKGKMTTVLQSSPNEACHGERSPAPVAPTAVRGTISSVFSGSRSG